MHGWSVYHTQTDQLRWVREGILVRRKLVKRRSLDGPKLRFLRFTLHERRFTIAALPLASAGKQTGSRTTRLTGPSTKGLGSTSGGSEAVLEDILDWTAAAEGSPWEGGGGFETAGGWTGRRSGA